MKISEGEDEWTYNALYANQTILMVGAGRWVGGVINVSSRAVVPVPGRICRLSSVRSQLRYLVACVV